MVVLVASVLEAGVNRFSICFNAGADGVLRFPELLASFVALSVFNRQCTDLLKQQKIEATPEQGCGGPMALGRKQNKESIGIDSTVVGRSKLHEFHSEFLLATKVLVKLCEPTFALNYVDG
eukprot:4107663-Amphidinium_carterae.2